MLNDRAHVEGVAIMRSLVEHVEPIVGQIDPIKAAYVWLAENHPEPTVYMAAISGTLPDEDKRGS